MVLYITMNGNSGTCVRCDAFALMYRRANGTSYEAVNVDGLVKTRESSFSVVPAKAGIQEYQGLLDPGVRRGDGLEDFLPFSSRHFKKLKCYVLVSCMVWLTLGKWNG
jgi:hypothetical protein